MGSIYSDVQRKWFEGRHKLVYPSREEIVMMNNKEKDSITYLLKRLWGYISEKRRHQLGLLFILMLFSSVAEIVSIGEVIPFLGILSSPEQVFQYDAIQPIILFFDFKSPEDLVWPITISFIAVTIFAGAIRLILVFVNTRLSFATGHDLSINIYNKTHFNCRLPRRRRRLPRRRRRRLPRRLRRRPRHIYRHYPKQFSIQTRTHR